MPNTSSELATGFADVREEFAIDQRARTQTMGFGKTRYVAGQAFYQRRADALRNQRIQAATAIQRDAG